MTTKTPTTPQPQSEYIGATQIAKTLSVSRSVAYALLHQLKPVRLGARPGSTMRVRRVDFEQFLAERHALADGGQDAA